MRVFSSRPGWIITVILSLACVSAAQEVASVSLLDSRQTLRLKIDPVDALTRTQLNILSNIANYQLFEIQSPNDPLSMRGVDRTGLIVLRAPDCEFTCTRVTLELTTPLQYGSTFMLKVNGLVLDNSPFPPIRFDIRPKADIAGSIDSAETRRELRIKSQVSMVATPAIIVEEKRLEITKDNSKVKENTSHRLAAPKKDVTFPANDFPIILTKKLAEATAYTLVIRNGISDGSGTNLPAKGTIKIPGLPAPPDAPSIDLKLSTLAAVHQKPQFDLVANLSRPNRYMLGLWYWEPKLTADLGLGQTKSKNAIIIDLPFRKYIFNQKLTFVSENSISDVVGEQGEWAKIPTYLGWKRTPWHRLGSIKFSGGPKFESDRRFGRINALGSARFDLRFQRWLATIRDKRNLLNNDLEEGMADRIPIDSGFNLVPYVSIDAGGRVNSEVVENTKRNAREVIQQFGIVRGNIGLSSLIQWRLFSFPMTLTLTEDGFYLFKRETVGLVTDTGIGFRRLKGWHNRSTASWDIFLDPAKRLSFNFSYENGRSAPNFEYLNKVSTGFRVIY